MKSGLFGLLVFAFFILTISVAAFHFQKLGAVAGSSGEMRQTSQTSRQAATSPLGKSSNQPPVVSVGSGSNSLPSSVSSSNQSRREVLDLAAELDRINQPAAAFDARVGRLTAQLTTADADQLTELAMSTEHTHNQRYLAVYMLAQRPSEFHLQLETIARSENPLLAATVAPHSLAELQRHFEEAHRATALGAIDSLSVQGSQEAQFFADLRVSSKNPFIRKLAGMGYVGAQNGQALINRYLNAQ